MVIVKDCDLSDLLLLFFDKIKPVKSFLIKNLSWLKKHNSKYSIYLFIY